MSRGNGGEVIYRTDEDRRRFLGRGAGLPERFGTEIPAFVLMANHYHLLVRCRRSDFPRSAQKENSCYHFANLWFAVGSTNWPLADFYARRMVTLGKREMPALPGALPGGVLTSGRAARLAGA